MVRFRTDKAPSAVSGGEVLTCRRAPVNQTRDRGLQLESSELAGGICLFLTKYNLAMLKITEGINRTLLLGGIPIGQGDWWSDVWRAPGQSHGGTEVQEHNN